MGTKRIIEFVQLHTNTERYLKLHSKQKKQMYFQQSKLYFEQEVVNIKREYCT